MGARKEDVEKFLDGNPAFAKQYFSKKLDAAALAKMSGLPQKQIDFSHFQELSQVNKRGEKKQITASFCSIMSKKMEPEA